METKIENEYIKYLIEKNKERNDINDLLTEIMSVDVNLAEIENLPKEYIPYKVFRKSYLIDELYIN